MKKLIFAAAITVFFISCANEPGNESSNAAKKTTASDTISRVTNPGVGTAADDTTKKPF